MKIELIQRGVFTEDEIYGRGTLVIVDDIYYIDVIGNNHFVNQDELRSTFHAFVSLKNKENSCFELSLRDSYAIGRFKIDNTPSLQLLKVTLQKDKLEESLALKATSTPKRIKV